MATVVNALMSRAGIRLKRDRVKFWDEHDYWIRSSKCRGVEEAAIFFRTAGCRHDQAGGCTMCDYSAGPPTDAAMMVDIVRRALEEVPEGIDHLLFSPSGSFLDEWEVPVAARLGILDLMASTHFPRLSFETRAETLSVENLSTESLDEYRQLLVGRAVKVYIGLESADPWVSKYSINKQLCSEDFCRGVARLRSHSMKSSANVLLGAPFLSPREALDDTLTTARWAFDVAGVDECCLFPTHVKRWTQVQWLWEQGLYRPPSLWSLIEVLQQLCRERPGDRLEVAWYTSNDAFNVLDSPSTCPACREEVISALSRFAQEGDPSALDWAVALGCSCRDRWRESLSPRGQREHVAEAERAYSRIARALLPDEWWQAHGDAVLGAVRSDARRLSDSHGRTSGVSGTSSPGPTSE